VGEQTDSLDEKVTQGKVAWTNFINDLGVAIAQSPVLAAGLDSVKASLLAAFGGDQKALIAAIAKGVTDAAIVVVDFGIGAAAVAGAFVQVWYGIKTAVLAVETVIVGLVTAIGEVLLAADKMAGKLHLVDDAEVAKMQATQDALRGMTVGLAAETAEAAKGALGQSALNQTIDKGTGILLTMRDSMIAAQAAQEAQTTSTAAFIGPIQQAGVALKAHGDYLKEDAEAAKKYADAWVELTSMGNGFAETMATINPKILQEIQYYLQAGASVHTLAAAYPELSTAQVTAVEEWNKANIRVSAELTKVSDEYYKAVNAASHDSVQRQIDDAYLTASTRIAQMEKTKSYSVEAELLIWKTAEQTSDNIIAKTLESDVHSRAHFELIADQAKNAYDFAQAHADQYTSEWIVQLQKTADAARLAADGALGKVDAHIGATLGAFHQLAMASAAATIPAGATSKYPDTIEGRLAMLADQQAQDPTRFINTSGLFAGVPMTQARAGGGDVGAGQPYLVGERGPELFVPQSNGSIVPNSGGGDVNVKIYVNGTAADVARQVAAELTRTMKTARKYA
jgi:hypothetical protein